MDSYEQEQADKQMRLNWKRDEARYTPPVRARMSKEQMFRRVAALVANRSHCGKAQVGCVITDMAGARVAIGYNGLAAGGDNACGVTDPDQRCACIHAEVNACIKAQWSGDKIAYVTHQPCHTCEAVLKNTGVVQVHW